MILALIRKELNDLRPILWLQVIGIPFIVVWQCWDGPRMETLAETIGDDEASLGPLLLLAVAVGVGLSNREKESGTLRFLDGLPVSRSAVFLSKVLASCIALSLTPALIGAEVLLQHLVAARSLQPDLHLHLVVEVMLLQLAALTVSLLIGAAAGIMRSLAWPMLALGWLAIDFATEFWPRMSGLLPGSLTDVPLVGTRWELSAEAVAMQLGVAGAAAAVAWIGFLLADTPRNVEIRPWVTGVLSVFSGGLVLVAGFHYTAELNDDDEERDGAIDNAPGAYLSHTAAGLAETTHYRFSYVAIGADPARALAAEADAIAERVSQLTGLPIGDPIEVDTSGSQHNTAGTAFTGSIRMRLGGRARALLAHETSHVISQRRAGDEGASRWRHATLLNEGLAEWVERHFKGDEDIDGPQVLAILSARHQLDVAALMDLEAFGRTHDQDLKYPIGAALIDALVRVGGPEAPGRVVGVFADPSLPSDLSGPALYQAVFQLAGVDLARVLHEVHETASTNAARWKPWIDDLPRPSALLVTDGARTGAQVSVDGVLPPGWKLSVRFRPDEDSPLKLYRSVRPDASGIVWRRPADISHDQICLQAGLTSKEGTALYEPWACIPVSVAAPWAAPAEP